MIKLNSFHLKLQDLKNNHIKILIHQFLLLQKYLIVSILY